MSVKKTQDPIIVTPPKPLPIPSPTFSLEEGEQGTSEAEVITEPKARFVGDTHEEIPEWPGPYHVTENGLYETAGYEFSTDLLVEVPPKGLTEITIEENGTYKPSDYDGYSKVVVDVQPILEELEVTENGEYLPTSPTQGFSKVTVLVEPPLVVDPVLENNSWEVIRAVCEAGTAGDYWALGDTKTVTGSDNRTRTVRIDDMSGLYGKHVVFSFLNRTETSETWAASNVNSYANSDVKTAIDAGGSIFSVFVDSALAAQLTNTTVQVAAGGNDGTLVSVTGKMFLPAEREIFASRTYSRTEEWDALTQYAYYSTVDTSADARKRYKASTPTTAGYWWLRSPYSGYTGDVCYVNYYGDADSISASNTRGVAPCFAF